MAEKIQTLNNESESTYTRILTSTSLKRGKFYTDIASLKINLSKINFFCKFELILTLKLKYLLLLEVDSILRISIAVTRQRRQKHCHAITVGRNIEANVSL